MSTESRETSLIENQFIKENLDDYKILLLNEKIIGRNKIGTEAYMPLESLLHFDDQTFSVDVWSIGVILFQILAKKYQIFNNLVFVRQIQNNNIHKKYNKIVSFILELALIFGSEKIIKLLEKFGTLFVKILISSNRLRKH